MRPFYAGRIDFPQLPKLQRFKPAACGIERRYAGGEKL
jgi:hypothetical protein